MLKKDWWSMGNGIEKDRGIQGTLWKWAEESKLPLPAKKGSEGQVDGRQVVEFVFSHFEKFSPKIQKQIEVLQKSFRALGFTDDEAKAILSGDPKTGAKRLIERGQDFEKRAAEAKAEKKPQVAGSLLEQAERAYRLALGIDPKDFSAHRQLAGLLYARGDIKAGREEAGLAIQSAPAKEVPPLIVWLQAVQDPTVKNGLSINFAASNLIGVKRFDDAKNLYEAAARRLAKEGDEAKAQKYREKALVVEELAGSYVLAFNEKSNPEVTKLYDALRAEGIPSGSMIGADADKKLVQVAQVLAFVDRSLEDPRVQQALKACGLTAPKPGNKAEQEAFAKLSFSQKLSLQHLRQAEAASGAKQKERHLAAAAHFDPTSAPKLKALAEFHAEHRHSAQAMTAYEELLRVEPANVEGQRALAKLYLAEDRWAEAYKVLPRPEAETLLIGKLDKAREFTEAKDFTKAETTIKTAWKLLEDSYKGRGNLSADESGRILRLKANLDLTAGALHALKEGDAHGVQGFRQTVEACNEAIQKNPKDVVAYLLRAKGQEKLGQDKLALADYRAAAKLSPDGLKSLPEEYLFFTDRYRDRLRGNFQAELADYKRFAYETGDAEQKKTEVSMAKLESLAADLKDFPVFSDTQRFEDQKLVRDFLKFRVQHQEALGKLVYVGVSPEPVKFSTGEKAKHVVLGVAGFGGAGKIDEMTKRAEAEIERIDKHNARLQTMGYAVKKGQYEADLKAMEEGMRELRNRLLPSLELKAGEESTLDQVTNAAVVCGINRELGHYSGLATTLDKWKNLVDHLSPLLLDSDFRVQQYGQMIGDWKTIRAVDAKTYPSVLPEHDDITAKINSIFYGESGLNKIVESYAKAQGLAWNGQVYDNLRSAIIVGDESQDTRLMTLLTPDGVKALFQAHQQAEKFEQMSVIAFNEEKWSEGQALAMKSLQLYAQIGNAEKVEETIDFVDTQLKYKVGDDTVSNTDMLQTYQAMAEALNGSGLYVKGDFSQTYEDKVLKEARRYANSLTQGYVFGHASSIRGLVAARSFYEWDRDEASIQEVDKKLADGRKDLEESVVSRVSGVESPGERDSVTFGTEFGMYSVESRKSLLIEASALMEADLALIATQDLSKKEVREEYGNKILGHLDLWRRGIAASPQLEPEFRMEQYRQLAATVALLNKKDFTEGENAIFRKTDPNPDDGFASKIAAQVEAKRAAWYGPSLETQTKAISEMGKSMIEENSFAFYDKFPSQYQGVIQTVREHGLSKRIEEGIIGNYMEVTDDSDRRLTKADWKEIEKISTIYRGDPALQENLIESYLVSAGKFSPLDEAQESRKTLIQADYQARFDSAMKAGDAEFISVMGTESFREFRDVAAHGHDKMAESLNPALPKTERLEAALEAAAVFGQLGIQSRAEEALIPVKAHIDAIEDPAKRATGYLSLAQVYEMAGMDESAKGQLQKVIELDKPGVANGKVIHEMATFAKAKIQLADGNLDGAKKLLSEIQDNPLAKEILGQIDGVQVQQRVGYPMEFLSGVLLAEIDKRRGTNRDDIKYHLETKDKADKFMFEAQSLLKEAQRLCDSGECNSLQQAMEKLRHQGNYFVVFSFLDSTGRGKDTLAYIKTMENPALSDVQMAGETLQLAEKLLSRDDFDFAMKVSAGLLDDPFVSKQAKELVKNRIPDSAKWQARKQAIWRAVKDILIVPAIIEGRYGDAFISAVTTIASFGIGRIFSAGAKMAWAGMTARSVARVGWMARFAAAAPRTFKVAGTLTVAMADNAGFAVGGMMMESVVTGKNQFSWKRLKHELLIGIAPFGLIHGSGKVMEMIGKKAEHIPWMKVANETEAALLKAEGKLAITQGSRAGIWVTHRMMNATAFTVGGFANQKVGLIEEEHGPLALVFLQNLLTNLQMTAAHKGVNALTGGRMDAHERKLDQELHLAPTLARLKVNPKTTAGKAMVAFLHSYSDSLAAERGKPVGTKELADIMLKFNDATKKILQKTGMTEGNAFEAARAMLFMTAANQKISADQFAAYADRIGKIPALDGIAADLLPKGSQSDRDTMKSNLLFWALGSLDHPLNVKERLAELSELSPKISENLRQSVEGLLGPGALDTARGKRLAEVFLVRVLSNSSNTGEVAQLLKGLAEHTPALGERIDTLMATNGLKDPKARLALVEWATDKKFDIEAFDYLQKEMERGEVVLRFADGTLTADRVPPEGQSEARDRHRENAAVGLSQKLKLTAQIFEKNDVDRFNAMTLDAAKASKVGIPRAKELFLRMLPAIEKHVDSLHRDGVLRAVFLEILGGQIGETRAKDLVDKLVKGEIVLEVSEFGKMATRERKPEDRKADTSDTDTTVIELRKPKATPPPADSGKTDGDADTTKVGRPRSAGDEDATGVHFRDPHAGDTVIDLRDKKPAPVPSVAPPADKSGDKPVPALDSKKELSTRLATLEKLNAEIDNLNQRAKTGQLKPQQIIDESKRLGDEKQKVVDEINSLILQGALEAANLPASSHDMKVGDIVVKADGSGIGIVVKIDAKGIHFEGHGNFIGRQIIPHDQWSNQLFKVLKPVEAQPAAKAAAEGPPAMIPMSGRDAAEALRFTRDFEVYQNRVSQHPADRLPAKLQDRLRELIAASTADGNEQRVFAIEFADGSVVTSDFINANSPFNVKNPAQQKQVLQAMLDNAKENIGRGNLPVRVYDYHTHPNRGKLHGDGRLFTETNTTDVRSWEAAAGFFGDQFKAMGVDAPVVIEGGAVPVTHTEGKQTPSQDLPYVATYRNEVQSSATVKLDYNAKTFRQEFRLGSDSIADPRVASDHATIFETTGTKPGFSIKASDDPNAQTWIRDPKSDTWVQLSPSEVRALPAGKTSELRVGKSLADSVSVQVEHDGRKPPTLTVLKEAPAASGDPLKADPHKDAKAQAVGVAGFKPINEVEAKADKIAKAAPSPERVKRYEKYLIEQKKMGAAEAKVQAEAWAKQVIADAQAHQAGRTHIYDTSLPLRPETAHLDAATVDHHGRFANEKNSTEQLIDKMEAALESIKGDPRALAEAAKDKPAMDEARRGFADAGVKNPTEKQLQEVAAAIKQLNLKEVTTDNLADGGWSVWAAKNQARIFADPALRKLITEATHFEDFTAFGTTYDVNQPGIRLQAALFEKYGEILKNHNIIGSDRFSPTQADQVMKEALAVIDTMVSNKAEREKSASEFFAKVEEASKIAAKDALIQDASVHQGDTNLSFFDLTKLGGFTVFQQWLALPRVSPSGNADTIQASVVPMKALEANVGGQAIKAERKLQIVAIPNGRALPSGKGMTSVLETINQAELAKAEALGLVPKEGEAPKEGQMPRDHFGRLWFGKENVILPNPMKGGSLLTPKEVGAILTDQVTASASTKLGLFAPAAGNETAKPESGNKAARVIGTPTGDAHTAVLGKDKKGPKRGESTPSNSNQPIPRAIPSAAHSGDAAPIPERQTPTFEPYLDTKSRVQDERTVGYIHDYYSADGTKAELASIAKRSDRWGAEAKKFQTALAEFEKASREYFAAEKKIKSQAEADADPGLQQKFRELSIMADYLEGSPYHHLEKAHTEMIKDLGKELWPLENALAKIQFNDLGQNFVAGQQAGQSPKTEASFDFRIEYTNVEGMATYGGEWKGLSSQRLAKAEVTVDSWSRAEEIIRDLRQEKVKKVKNGKEVTEYALEMTGELSKSSDGRQGTLAVTVKGPPAHTFELNFTVKGAQVHDSTVIELRNRTAKPKPAKEADADTQPIAAAAGAGDTIPMRTVTSEPSFDGRSGHDFSAFKMKFAGDYYETVQTSDDRRNMAGGLLVPHQPGDPAPTSGTVWTVKAVQGDRVLLENGTSFKNGKPSQIAGEVVVKMQDSTQYGPGDEVRFFPPVAGGSGEAKSGSQLRPPPGAESFLIGNDQIGSLATVTRGADGRWHLLDGTVNADNEHKPSPNGVKAWDGYGEFPVGRDHWFALKEGQWIKIGEHWMEFHAGPTETAKPTEAAPTAAPKDYGNDVSHVEVPQEWLKVSEALTQDKFAVDQIPTATREFNVFAGDPAQMNPKAGPSLVLSGTVSGEPPVHQGKFSRDPDGGWSYQPNGQQVVYGRDLLPKQPEKDGSYRVEDGDIFTWGYKYFEFSQGKIGLQQDATFDALMPTQLALHLPQEAALAARGQADDFREHFPRPPLFDPQILSGSVDLNQPVPVHNNEATVDNGEFARATSQGVGYKAVNEDVIFSARSPDGKLLMLDVDGMGGYADGDAAATLVAEAFAAEYGRSGDTDKAWQLANQAVLRFNGASIQQKMGRDAAMDEARKIIADPSLFALDPIAKGSGAVAVMVEQSPPSHDGSPAVARFEWVGDAKAMQLRADANGRLQWIYRTVDEGLASEPGMLQPGVDFETGGQGKTLVVQLHPKAHVVTNAIGTGGTLEVRGTQHGETPNPKDPSGSNLVGDAYAQGIALQPKDWVILASDGFWENFGRTELILNIMDKASTADEATRLLTDEAHWRMDILAQAKAGTLPRAENRRYIFEKPGGIYYIDGKGKWRKAQSLEIDRSGAVYEPGGTKAVDHFKNDNFSLTVYRHNPSSKDVAPQLDGRSGHDPQSGDPGQGVYGKNAMEMKVSGQADGSTKDLKDLRQGYADKQAALLKDIESHGAIEGTARSYEAKEFAELLHLVLERGQPIETLPSAKGIRGQVEDHMYAFVVEVDRRFPEEFKKAGKQDPETGESFLIKGNDGKMKQNIPAMYRFAKRLMNQKMGLPVHGAASPKQKESVLGFVEGALGKKDIGTYEKAADHLRQEFRKLSPEFQRAYKAANPALRSALLDSLFDGKRFATFNDRAEAIKLIRFLGKAGYHQEFGLTADLSKQPAEYLLALGDLTAAINPRPGLIALIHSHPRLYVNRRRNLMGHRDTLDVGSGKEVGHSASILFSHGDLDGMVHDAERLNKEKVSLPGFLDNGVYRNWVQHSFGLSEAELRIGRDGKVTELTLRYGFYDGISGLDGSHTAVRKQVEAYARKAFPNVKITYEEVPAAQIESRMP